MWDALRAAERRSPRRARGCGDILAPRRFHHAATSSSRRSSRGRCRGARKLLARLGEEARDPIEELVNAALAFEARGHALAAALPRLVRSRRRRYHARSLRAARCGAGDDGAWRQGVAGAAGDPRRRDRRSRRAAGGPRSTGRSIPTRRTGAGARARARTSWPAASPTTLADAERREREEHWRLLYVAATRAEERLVIGGALGVAGQGRAAGARAGIARSRTRCPGSAPSGRRIRSGARRGIIAAARRGARRAARRAARAPLPPPAEPDWLRRAPPQEERPPRPLAPSAIGPDRVADPPPSPAMRAAADRGRLLHALFERLPALAAGAARWRRRRAGWRAVGRGGRCRRSAPRWSADACAIIADPRFADLFGPDALAEAPIAAVVGGDGDRRHGRSAAGDGRARCGWSISRPGGGCRPGSTRCPRIICEQMAAYVAALEVVFPGRRGRGGVALHRRAAADRAAGRAARAAQAAA